MGKGLSGWLCLVLINTFKPFHCAQDACCVSRKLKKSSLTYTSFSLHAAVNSNFSLSSHLDAHVVHRNDGVLQRGQAGLIQRLPHHHFGCHVDKVHTDCFWHEREGAWRPQITLDHLKGSTTQVLSLQKCITTHILPDHLLYILDKANQKTHTVHRDINVPIN